MINSAIIDEEMRKQLAVWLATWNRTEIILRDIEKKANSEFLQILGPEKGFLLAEEIRKARGT